MADQELNYENDRKIDVDALDIEWAFQADKFGKYASWAADCREQMDLAKEALDLTIAELDEQIRLNPERYGITDRVTEPAVKNATIRSQEYKDASRAYIKAKKQMEVSKGAVAAMDQKRASLENLVFLFKAQYFAGPAVPRDLSVEWSRKQQEKNSDEAIGQAMKLKRIRKPNVA